MASLVPQFSRSSSPPRVTAENTLGFCQLPVDIVLLILDHLPLHSRIFVSQTCRGLRAALRNSCIAEIRKLKGGDLDCLLAQLAFSVPGVWYCPACKKQHSIDRTDVPGANSRSFYTCPTRALMPSGRHIHIHGEGYSLSPIHVYFALKLSRSDRLRVEDHRYLAKLLASYEKVDGWDSSVQVRYKAQPKVVGQTFLLHSSWHLTHNYNTVRWSDLPGMTICPHLIFRRSLTVNATENILTEALAAAFIITPGVRSASCLRCPTDIEIQIHDRRMSLLVWQDMGSDGCSWNLEWKRFIRFYDYNCLVGQGLPRIPGIVKDMYRLSESESS